MAEQRYQAVMAVIGDGLSISQVAEKVGVSRQTLHAWLARYEDDASRELAERGIRADELSSGTLWRTCTASQRPNSSRR